MYRSILALSLGLVMSATCLAQQSLVGTYKLLSVTFDGKPREALGASPHGYLIITPKYLTIFYTGDKRKFGTSDSEKAALWDTLLGLGGTYRIDGSRIVIAIDVSYNEYANGKSLLRNWQVEGRRLTLTSDPEPFGRDPSRKVVLQQQWEKLE